VDDRHIPVLAGDLVAQRPAGQERRTFVWRRDVPDWHLPLVSAPFKKTVHGPVTVFYTEGSAGPEVTRISGGVLESLREWLGPADIDRVTIVEIPDGYGGEARRGYVLSARSTFRPPGDGASAREWLWEKQAHELMHTWSPDSNEDHNSRWLDEGITHYLELVLRAASSALTASEDG